MKSRIWKYVMAIVFALFLCGCGNGEAESARDTERKSKEEFTSEASSDGHETEQQPFENLKTKRFYFSSGAGAWATTLVIRADGSFSGEHLDDDMGDTGDEYPNGTRYQSRFNGRFSQPVKVNDYTYSMQVDLLQYEREPDTQEIIDGVRYCYGKAHGLDEADQMLLYLPDAPIEELPEEFKSWTDVNWAPDVSTDKLSFYGLYNETMQFGFSSSDIIEDAKQMLSTVEEQVSVLENSISQGPLTQADYNEKTKEIYDLWDDALNMIWKSLKETKSADEMQTISKEEKEWISFKEQETEKAGAGYEGGTMFSMIVNQKAAELTKARVYELLELLE